MDKNITDNRDDCPADDPANGSTDNKSSQFVSENAAESRESTQKDSQNSRPRRLCSDVTVAGAGLAGICAAVAAAREGLSVILVNDRSVPGGNASSEIGISINGASHLGLNPAIYAREGGLAEEIRMRMLEYNRGGGYDRAALTDAVLFDMIYQEAGITLLLNTGIYECEKEGNRITLCRGRHSISNLVYEMESKFYIDATGNGELAYQAGASFRMGREGRAEYGERKAPISADAYTMGNTFYFETRDCGHEVTYTPPAFAGKVGEMDFIRNIDKPGTHRAISAKGAHWSFEYGGQRNVVYDSEEIDLELRRLVFGIWDYVKNSGRYPEAKNYVLKRVYARSGARESRRFLGDYVLTENDIEKKRDFPDAVCIGGWPMDVHAPLGIYDPGPATEFIPVTGIYNIPFRCLYSKDVENLMMAGRNISATHVALGSTRVMATCACMGQAVGTAARCCMDLGITPAALGKYHPHLLREKLARADQTVAGLKELSPLMENFRASASGEKCFENDSITVKRKLDRAYGLALMLATEHLDSLQLWVENVSGQAAESEKQTERDKKSDHKPGGGVDWKKQAGQAAKLEFQILEGTHRETFLPERLVKTAEQTVEAGFRGWLRLDLNADRGQDGKIYLILKPNPDLWVGMTSAELPGAVTLRLYPEGACGECNHDSVPLNPESGYLYLDHRYNRWENMTFRGIFPPQRVFAPEMALTPYTRPYGMPNLWIGSGVYPRTLTLTAEHPVDAEHLAVTFDTDLRSEPLSELPGCLVRDFDVTVWMEESTFREEGSPRGERRFPEERYSKEEELFRRDGGFREEEGFQEEMPRGEKGLQEERHFLEEELSRKEGISRKNVIFREEVRDNCRRQVRFLIKGKKIGKIEITIHRSWGGDAGIYGVNLW